LIFLEAECEQETSVMISFIWPENFVTSKLKTFTIKVDNTTQILLTQLQYEYFVQFLIKNVQGRV